MTAAQFTRRRQKLFSSQSAFARVLKVSPRAVSWWENGKRPVPGYAIAFLECCETLKKLKRD